MKTVVRIVFVSWSLLVIVAGEMHARNPTSDKPQTRYECRWAHGKIAIDGKADEEVWQDAQQIDHFYLPWLRKHARRSKTATSAKMLWDRSYIYFLAEMEDVDLFADVRQHDGRTWHNDVFELFLKPAEDKTGYYEFQVNAANTRMDMFVPQRAKDGYDRYVREFPFEFDSAVLRRGTLNQRRDRDQGWTVEGRISWASFIRTGGPPVAGERWKFALCRYDYSVDSKEPELSTCAPLRSRTVADFHRHEDYATLEFVGPVQTKSKSAGAAWRMKFPPLTKSRIVGTPDPPKPYRAVKAFPNLKIDFPICVRRIPNTDRMLVINASRSYAPSSLLLMTDTEKTTGTEMLLRFPGVAYDITFHPRFDENGFVYIGGHSPKHKGAPHCLVTRYTMQRKPPFKLDPKSAQVIIEWPSNGHNGAAVVFGNDGMLYVTSGDGTVRRDTDQVGQRLDTLRAKVLRLDVDRPGKDRAYSVPKDNPFVDFPDARAETWSYGLRNPWRIAVDRKTGHLWVGNNGQDTWEQVYLIRRGANYGWSVYEGGNLFIADRALGSTPVSKPTFDHHHAEARSITGGIVYHGEKHPELRGAYIYGDHSTGKIWAARHDGEKVLWHKEIADTALAITCFAEDARGELLIADHRGGGEGGFYRLQKRTISERRQPFPQTLSDTGLFLSVADHELQPGVLPYSVNVPGWHDGASAQRYLALPAKRDGDGNWTVEPIQFTTGRSWRFPDGTVILQTLSLETQPGNSESRRRVETRMLTRQQGEWAGYSYVWNDEQTEATLVARRGRAIRLQVEDGAVKRQFTWQVPSRTSCMSCHSRAAEYVLGLNELQMNRQHTYGRRHAHQFEVLEGAGFLRDSSWNRVARETWRTKLSDKLRLENKGLSANDFQQELKKRLGRITKTSDQRTPPSSSMLPKSAGQYRQLPDPFAKSGDIASRAKSYLHANCAHCHVLDGGGNARIVLQWGTADQAMNLAGVQAMHGKFGLSPGNLVTKGDPDRSVLAYRLATLGGGRMPRVGSHHVDVRGLQLIRRWIESMEPDRPKSEYGEMIVRLATAKDNKTIDQATDQLAASTSGALHLLAKLDRGAVPSLVAKRAALRAARADQPAVRSLFERFLPEEDRPRRLGPVVHAQTILGLPGNAERGRRLFFEIDEIACRKCHKIGGRGEMLGPDLSAIGKKYDKAQLLASILNPSQKIDDQFATWSVRTQAGRVHSGLILKQDDQQLVLKTADAKTVRIPADEIDQVVRQRKSLMPDLLLKDLTAIQAADLLEFLSSLK